MQERFQVVVVDLPVALAQRSKYILLNPFINCGAGFQGSTQRVGLRGIHVTCLSILFTTLEDTGETLSIHSVVCFPIVYS